MNLGKVKITHPDRRSLYDITHLSPHLRTIMIDSFLHKQYNTGLTDLACQLPTLNEQLPSTQELSIIGQTDKKFPKKS